MNRKFVKILFALIIVLGGCNKKNDSVPSGTYLKRIIYHQNADQIRNLYYNNKGLLSNREFQFGNLVNEKLEYQYNNSMISRIRFYEPIAYNESAFILKRYLQFEYQNDLIIKSTLFPDNYIVNYEYDNAKRIIKLFNLDTENTFEYDTKGNITKETLKYSGAISTFIRTYDDKRNPLYKVDLINGTSAFIDVLSYYCPNNIIKEITIFNADTTNINVVKYEYNKYNLPETMNSIKYEYENR